VVKTEAGLDESERSFRRLSANLVSTLVATGGTKNEGYPFVFNRV